LSKVEGEYVLGAASGGVVGFLVGSFTGLILGAVVGAFVLKYLNFSGYLNLGRFGYTGTDFVQAAIGSFSTAYYLFFIRSGDPVILDATASAGVTFVWFGLLYFGFRESFGDNHIVHYFGSLIATVGVCSVIAVIFHAATWNEILHNFFGSSVIGAMWGAFPVALVFDLMDLRNPLSRIYVRGRKSPK